MIKLADRLGFCYGVNRAVKKAYEMLEKQTESKGLYLYGNIVNNIRVIEDLTASGATVTNDISTIPDGAAVIIRAHGVGRGVLESLESRGVHIVDMTCVDVKKIHSIVADRYSDGCQIVIFGGKEHAEVIGTNGWCDNSAWIIENELDFEAAFSHRDTGKRLCVVGQTTFSREKWNRFTEKLREICPSAEIIDTLCNSTRAIQESAKALAIESDAIIVIGDTSSSNSRELYRACKNINANTYMANSLADVLDNGDIANYDNIGITAGASAPWVIINEIKDYLTFYQFLNAAKNEIDIELDRFFSWKLSQNADNTYIISALNELREQTAGGKRIRGALIKLGMELASSNSNGYLSVAAAYELFQTSILIHDDIMDKSDSRRGKQTIHAKMEQSLQSIEVDRKHYGISKAISIGDYGIFMAYSEIARAPFDDKTKSILLNCYSDILEKTGQGELMDVSLPYEHISNPDALYNSIIRIYELKTAWYTIAGPLYIGAAAGGASPEMLETIKLFGVPLGIAFQIKDDIMGIYSNEDISGKSAVTDIAEKKQTLLYYYALKTATADQRLILDTIYGTPNPTSDDLSEIRRLFEETGAKQFAKDKMKQYMSESCEILAATKAIGEKSTLYGLIEYLSVRKF